MKIGQAEQWLIQQLQTVYTEQEPQNIASLVMEHITGLTRSERTGKTKVPLNVHQLHHLTEINQRLLLNEPIQYITGHTWFAGMKLYVDHSVLIPRPETEELVDWIIKDVKNNGLQVFEKQTTDADRTTELKILDVGTGSGCIALALKKAMLKAEVWGCDISEEALNVARRNGSELDIRVDFQGINFLDEAQHKFLPSVDIVVSNPPYIPINEKERIPANVLQHEPHAALFVSEKNSLIFYKSLAAFARNRLHPGGSIYAEINEDLGKEATALFAAEGFSNIELKKDMQGKDRMLRVSL